VASDMSSCPLAVAFAVRTAHLRQQGAELVHVGNQQRFLVFLAPPQSSGRIVQQQAVLDGIVQDHAQRVPRNVEVAGRTVGVVMGLHPVLHLPSSDVVDRDTPEKRGQLIDGGFTALAGTGFECGGGHIQPALGQSADKLPLLLALVVLGEGQQPGIISGDSVHLTAQFGELATGQFLVSRLETAANLLAITFEQGIVNPR